MPGTAAENRARMRAKATTAKRGGKRIPLKKKRANVSATRERALAQAVRKQGMRGMEVEGVTMVKEDDSLVVFKQPKFLLSSKGGAFVVQGKHETKTATEGIAHMLGMSSGLGAGFGADDLARVQEILARAKAGGLGAGVDTFDAGEDEEDEEDEGDGDDGVEADAGAGAATA